MTARQKKRIAKRGKKQQQSVNLDAPEKYSSLKMAVIIALTAMAVVSFGFGKYFEFSSPGAFDSGAYVYSAEHILNGAKIGVDENPSAQAGTLLMNMLGVKMFGFNDIGPKVVQMLLQITAFVLMFIAIRKLFSTLSAAVAVIVASVYLSAPVIAKYGNVKEQFMIAFMIIGISFFILQQKSGKWWFGVLAGGALAWAPLFKQTGLSAIGAVGVFLLISIFADPARRKQHLLSVLLLITGAIVALSPVYLWLILCYGQGAYHYLPYKFLWDMAAGLFHSSNGSLGGSYIKGARKLSDFKTQAGRVFRYYWMLRLPVFAGLSAIALWIYRYSRYKFGRSQLYRENFKQDSYDKFVLIFGLWWILDMAFVWISPRSYEQYYLPLNASAAWLMGYMCCVYLANFKKAQYKTGWVITGAISCVLILVMAWPIVFGISKSPHSGTDYGQKRRGYLQKLDEIKARSSGNESAWEMAGEYIREHTDSDDTIWVWGWVPGIYVKAGRLSPTIKPFTSEMHVMPLEKFKIYVKELVEDLKVSKPAAIVDTHKRHYPWNRPSLELWPMTKNGPIPNTKQVIASYDAQYEKLLKDKIGFDEDLRYKAMKPLRDFVMDNYKPTMNFGQYIIFELKSK